MIVVWRITEACNLACPFCAYDRRLKRSRIQTDETVARRFLRLLADYQRETGVGVLVSWLGGEPLLWPALPVVTLEGCDRGLSFSVTTNGTALAQPEIRALLQERFAEVTVSVDGKAERHDLLRGWTGGYSRLARHVTAMASESRRVGRGPRLRINTVLMHQTWEEFPAFCRELVSWGIDEITFNQLGGNDRPEFYPEHRLTPNDVAGIAAFLPELRAELATRGVRLGGGEGYLRRLVATSRGERLPVDDCQPGQAYLFIDEQDRVAPCHFTTDTYGASLASLTTVNDLLALPWHFSEHRRRQRHAACEDCHSTQVFEKFSVHQTADDPCACR